MSRIISKKRALLTAAIASLALVAVALAFYSTTGDGSGSATTADDYSQQLAIAGDADEGLVPGGSVDISGTVTNPNEGSAKVGAITGTVTSVDKADGVIGTCSADWFHVSGAALDAGQSDVLDADGGQSTFSATLGMADALDTNGDPVDQDACKGATVNFDWSSN